MKVIKLNKGKIAIVGDNDYKNLFSYNWYALESARTFYAYRNESKKVGGKWRCKMILMHREIMKTPDGMVVDHKDLNGLNNQRNNLRNCTYVENNRRLRGQRNNSSKYKGVTRNGRISWKALIFVANKKIYLGSFLNEKDAAIAYNRAAEKHFKEFAYLNEIN